jgi:hypothetical protein
MVLSGERMICWRGGKGGGREVAVVLVVLEKNFGEWERVGEGEDGEGGVRVSGVFEVEGAVAVLVGMRMGRTVAAGEVAVEGVMSGGWMAVVVVDGMSRSEWYSGKRKLNGGRESLMLGWMEGGDTEESNFHELIEIEERTRARRRWVLYGGGMRGEFFMHWQMRGLAYECSHSGRGSVENEDMKWEMRVQNELMK